MKVISPAVVAALNTMLVAKFNNGQKGYKPTYRKFAAHEKSNDESNTYAGLGTFPRIREWGGEAIIDHLESIGYRILNKQFDSTIGVPMQDVQREKLVSHARIMSGMGVRASQHADRLCYEVLATGFTSTLAYDGKPLFASNHEWSPAKKGSVSNVATGGGSALSEASLRAGLAYGRALRDPEGAPINEGATPVLIVPGQLEYTAKGLVKATKDAGGQNELQGAAEVLVSGWLPSATAWFLVWPSEENPAVIFQEEVPLSMVAASNPDDPHVLLNKEFLFNTYGRSNAGAGAWQSCYGATGA